jgi:hypothetical protein
MNKKIDGLGNLRIQCRYKVRNKNIEETSLHSKGLRDFTYLKHTAEQTLGVMKMRIIRTARSVNPRQLFWTSHGILRIYTIQPFIKRTRFKLKVNSTSKCEWKFDGLGNLRIQCTYTLRKKYIRNEPPIKGIQRLQLSEIDCRTTSAGCECEGFARSVNPRPFLYIWRLFFLKYIVKQPRR